MSPIGLRHVSLTHPQTPINRSLPKAFEEREDSEVQKLCKNQVSKNFNFEYKEHSKKNHPNHLPRSQRSLESSSKASRDVNKLQIGEALRIQASKAPKNFRHKPSNKKEHSKQNHLNYLPRSQSSLESSSKASENITNHKSVKLYGFKPLKHRRTSTTNLQRRRTRRTREEHKEHEEQRISNKLIARDSLQFHFNNLRSIPQPN